MAKRSDFAQKLLDDLRLRKERMATSSHSQRSSQSNQLPIDAYAYSKQAHRGSRGMKPNDIINSRTGDILNRSSRSHGSGNMGEVSNQIVSYGRNHSSLQMNDISMALAFAFENGAKLRRTDPSFTSSIMGFLHQFKRGNMEFGKMERRGNMNRQLVSTSCFPTFSPMQIKEISRGAQKLNQILRACSDGYTVDRYSLEFAKELLQGAMDLEESLRVLVDMQKASEMVTPQKKNRIKLLDEDDEDEDDDYDMSEAKQLARPVFSFDKPSRHSQNLQETRNGRLMQRPIAVSYYKDGRNSRNEKKDLNAAKLASHKRSASYGSELKNPSGLSEEKNQSASSQSNKEKARIPNVVAKLMGLDCLPEKVKSKNTPQKGSGSTQIKEGKTTKKIELKNKQTENLVPPKKQKVVEAISMPANQHKELMLGANKNFIIQKANSEAAVLNGKPVWKDLDGIKASKGLEKATIKIDKKHEHIGKGRTKDPLLNNTLTQLEQAREKSEVRSSLHEETESNGSILQSGKRATNKHTMSNTKTSQNHLGIQKSNMLLKNGHQEEKPQRECRVQQSTKQKTSSKSMHEMINSQKTKLLVNQGSPLKNKSGDNVDAMRSEGFISNHYDDLIRDEGSNDSNVKVKEISNGKSGQISPLRDGESRPVKGRHVMMVDEKSVHKLANKKVKSTRMQKTDMSGKIDVVASGGRNGALLHKHQNSILPEERQRRSDKFNVAKEEHQWERIDMSKESEGYIISANNSVVIAESLDAKQQPHKEAQLPPQSYSPDGGKLQSLKEPVALVLNDSYQDVKSVTIDDMQDQASLVAADESKSFQNSSSTMTGTQVKMDISYNSQLEEQKISERRIQEPLTESENCLKWILVMSQLFLNTAEALFRLNIPLNILQGGIRDDHDEEGSKLVLDCGYEVMKRKGIRQELKVHPCSKISISTIKIRSLDELVRQLNRDMEKIKFYGRNTTSKADIEDYLPKMLENDVYGKDPDIDCMWDLGWNDDTFAFIEKYDVIRDMEKHILNGLLNDVTGELLHLQGINMTTQLN